MSARALRRTPGRERRGSVPSSARAPRVTLSAPCIEGNAWTYLKRCLDTGDVSAGGEYVSRFEAALADYTRAPAVVATSTGTAALHLALRLAGVTTGSVVLAPTLTFVATLNAVAYCGAEPWFVDVDPLTWNVSADTLARALRDARAAGRDPRFAMVTHLYGVPADLDGITALCAREGLTLLEDAAESLGSWWNGRHTGTFGRAAALSFNGNKIVTAGQGGALMLTSPDDAARARHLATQARVGRAGYTHDEVGFNYRMANLNAALGLAQVESLPSLRLRRRAVQASYQIALEEFDSLALQGVPSGAEVNGWLQGVRVTSRARCDRDALLASLDARGIDARAVFQPMHRQAMFRACGGACPAAEDVADTALNLPNGPDTDVPRVIRALREVL